MDAVDEPQASPPHGRFVSCPLRRQPDQRDDLAKAVPFYDKAFAFHYEVTRRTDDARAHRASPQRAPVSGQSLRYGAGSAPGGHPGRRGASRSSYSLYRSRKGRVPVPVNLTRTVTSLTPTAGTGLGQLVDVGRWAGRADAATPVK